MIASNPMAILGADVLGFDFKKDRYLSLDLSIVQYSKALQIEARFFPLRSVLLDFECSPWLDEITEFSIKDFEPLKHSKITMDENWYIYSIGIGTGKMELVAKKFILTQFNVLSSATSA